MTLGTHKGLGHSQRPWAEVHSLGGAINNVMGRITGRDPSTDRWSVITKFGDTMQARVGGPLSGGPFLRGGRDGLAYPESNLCCLCKTSIASALSVEKCI